MTAVVVVVVVVAARGDNSDGRGGRDGGFRPRWARDEDGHDGGYSSDRRNSGGYGRPTSYGDRQRSPSSRYTPKSFSRTEDGSGAGASRLRRKQDDADDW